MYDKSRDSDLCSYICLYDLANVYPWLSSPRVRDRVTRLLRLRLSSVGSCGAGVGSVRSSTRELDPVMVLTMLWFLVVLPIIYIMSI